MMLGMVYWISFIVLTAIMYICISLVGRFTGGEATSVWQSLRGLISPPVLGLILASNALYAIAIYYGFIVTSNALSISIALGVLVSFIYSCVFLGAPLTLLKGVGVVLVIIGIFLLK